jgi:Region found in RelA / SpoT proteins
VACCDSDASTWSSPSSPPSGRDRSSFLRLSADRLRKGKRPGRERVAYPWYRIDDREHLDKPNRVTSRAKAVGRLDAKVRQRAPTKQYTSVDAIYDDIVDLAGARVELYFPAERLQVESTIKGLFRVIGEPENFPKDSTETNKAYKRRFSGYSATHYRVYLRETSLSDAQKRYAEARAEIHVRRSRTTRTVDRRDSTASPATSPSAKRTKRNSERNRSSSKNSCMPWIRCQ